jgi:hypothetical protein
MMQKRISIALLLGIVSCCCLPPAVVCAQQSPLLKVLPKAPASPVSAFIGTWKGKLTWYVSGKPRRSFDMQLRILPADTTLTYTWQISYGKLGKDERPYLLRAVDTAKGHWVIDERNGIVLDSYLHGNSFTGAFTIQGKTIVDHYEVTGNQMRVSFYSFAGDTKTTTGKGNDDVPLVDSYRVTGFQTGLLTRAK